MPYESRCRPTSPPTTAAPQFSVPVDVASHTGAMQAQEHRIQRWAVATRTRNPSQEALMSCFSQRITRIRRISLFTFILHSSFFIWRSAPSFFTSEDKNSSNSCKTINNVMTAITINIPNHEVSFFKKMIAKMGWSKGKLGTNIPNHYR
jgi:hypothetical protein